MIEISSKLSSTHRVVLIEDEAMFRELLLVVLRRLAGLEVVGSFGLGQSGLDFCRRERPDFLVIDNKLPDLHGMEIVRLLVRELPRLKILMITAYPNARQASELMTLGVQGYVDQCSPIEHLIGAVESVRAGGLFFAIQPSERGVKVMPLEKPEKAGKGQLSLREREVARFVAAGRMSKEIAQYLNLSVRTVEKHRSNIRLKTGFREVASLTRWCIRVGLLEDSRAEVKLAGGEDLAVGSADAGGRRNGGTEVRCPERVVSSRIIPVS